MAELKNTPLREFHLEMGAKMVPRAGWNMPLNFSEGAADEEECCRTKAALFDFCADGRYRMAFPGALQAVEKLLYQGGTERKWGSCTSELLIDDEGMAVAFCRISLMSEDDLFITVPFRSRDRVEKLFSQKGLEYGDLSEYLCCIGISGPESINVLTQCGVSEEALPGKGETKILELDGLRAIVSFSQDLDDTGFEINCNAECADQIWDLFLETDIPWPAGLAAQESLRLARNVPGAAELQLPRSAADVKSKLGCVVFSGKRAPYAGVKLYDPAGNEAGAVTSSAVSAALGAALAFAFFPGGIPEKEKELHADASGVEIKGFCR